MSYTALPAGFTCVHPDDVRSIQPSIFDRPGGSGGPRRSSMDVESDDGGTPAIQTTASRVTTAASDRCVFEMKRFCLKVLALLSFMGGPWYVTDRLKGEWGEKAAFAAGFIPVGLMVFGALVMVEDERIDSCGRCMAWIGSVSAAVVAAESAYAAFRDGPSGPYFVGCLISFGAVAAYARLYRRLYVATSYSAVPFVLSR